MDPCPYVRILVSKLSIRFARTLTPTSSSSTIHPSNSPVCYCKVKLGDFGSHKSTLLLDDDEEDAENEESTRRRRKHSSASSCNSYNGGSGSTLPPAACFTFSRPEVEKVLLAKSKNNVITVEVYSGGELSGCGLGVGKKGKLMGKVRVPLGVGELRKLMSEPNSRGFYIHKGWVGIGSGSGSGSSGSKAEVYLSVRAEADPRYVFQFGGEPECSPQVFQVQGSAKQAVFTCKFSLRNSGDRALGSRSSMTEQSTSKSWLPSALGGDKDQACKERKGWTVTIHDLSGSPVAMASMVTPFVPSPGSNRVTQASPGAWLILRPSYGAWKPWGRLEAWREPSQAGGSLGYRFELLNDSAAATMASSCISATGGGKFMIDTTASTNVGVASSRSTPLTSPQGSFDLGSGSGSWSGSECPWPQFLSRGFVMSSTVEGSGKCSKPEVEIGSQHVTCTEDAAAFVALAAALDLSMDACRPFSHKLRKELRHQISQVV